MKFILLEVNLKELPLPPQEIATLQQVSCFISKCPASYTSRPFNVRHLTLAPFIPGCQCVTCLSAHRWHASEDQEHSQKTILSLAVQWQTITHLLTVKQSMRMSLLICTLLPAKTSNCISLYFKRMLSSGLLIPNALIYIFGRITVFF